MKTLTSRPKNRKLLLTVAIIAALTGVTGCSKESSPPAPQPGSAKAPVADTAATASPEARLIAAGEEIFKQMCKSCHGSRGNGLGNSRGPSLQRTEFTYGRTLEAVTQSIRDGRPGGMPSFSHVFTPEKLAAISSYVLSIKK
jgi:cytochrome c oxidase cbb3-type subunit 3